jgi:hypothetical protein
MSASEKLRFAVMLNGPECQQWQADAVAHLLSDPRLDLELLIIHDADSPAAKKTIARFWDKHLLLKVYRKFFMKLAVVKPVKPDWINATPQLLCAVKESGYSQYFSEHDILRIQSHRLDFILRFGFNILRGDVLKSAKYGIWSFHHGDEQRYRGGPPGFWEIMNDEPVTGAILQRLTPKLDSGVILKKGYFKTIAHSWPESFSQLLEHTAIWPLQVARDILNGHLDPMALSPALTQAPVYRFPRNHQMLRFLWKQFCNRISLYYNDLFQPELWNVGIINAPIESVLKTDNQQIKWLPKLPAHRFRADSFGFINEGKQVILFEDYDYQQGKGSLRAVDLDGKKLPYFTESQFHHSYPYIFDYKGETYCLPESLESGKLDLYLWEKELKQFSRVKTLMDNVFLADPTLVEIENRWWLFCTQRGTTNTLLYLYHAETPFGPFEPHANNPVKCDVQSSRPAGTVFNFGGRWFRPAQDCAKTYGHRIVIHEITAISPTQFSERAIKTILPQKPYGEGIHTLSAFGDKTLVDGKVFRFNRFNFKRQLLKKLGFKSA